MHVRINYKIENFLLAIFDKTPCTCTTNAHNSCTVVVPLSDFFGGCGVLVLRILIFSFLLFEGSSCDGLYII